MRKSPLRRKRPLRSTGALRSRSSLTRGGRVKPVNSERQAKRRKAYALKLAAYKRSETFKMVEARAGGVCEYVDHDDRDPWRYLMRCNASRENGTRLHHHHRTYARFGGGELPEDVEVLCTHHHDAAEAQHPTRRHGR